MFILTKFASKSNKLKLRHRWLWRGFLISWFCFGLIAPVMAQLPSLPSLPGTGGAADDNAAPWVTEIGETVDASIAAGNQIYPYIWGACVVKALVR